VVDLRTLNGEQFLESGAIADQILSVLMHVKSLRAAIRRILATIATLDGRAREEALGQLMVICGLRGIERDVEEEIKKVPVLNSLLDHKVLGREFKKGREQGIEEGLEQGLEQGLEKGLEKGLEQGRKEGEAKLLRRQLQRRFKKLPKWVVDKLATATPSQIEEWGVRLIEEKSLSAIFGRE
jgi:predicted transposase YdaD